MKCHCELCGGPAAVYRCIDPVVGVVYTCGGCRFPRMKEFRSVQPPQKLVPAVRVDESVIGPWHKGEVTQRCGAALVTDKRKPLHTRVGPRALLQRPMIKNQNCGKPIRDIAHCFEWEVSDGREGHSIPRS